jgi:hypothetical protein
MHKSVVSLCYRLSIQVDHIFVLVVNVVISARCAACRLWRRPHVRPRQVFGSRQLERSVRMFPQ